MGVANAALNRVNQVTPDGSLNYDITGTQDLGNGMSVPTYTATTKLSPGQQKIYDSTQSVTQGTADLANQYVKRITDATAQPYSYDGLPAAPTYDPAYVQKATNDIIARNQPQMDRDSAALTQQLANQGIPVGSDAWKAAMSQYQTGVNDFRLGAQNQGQGMASTQYGLEANTRDRAVSEMTNQRTQPINEVTALLGTGTGVQNPQFVNAPQAPVQSVDVGGNYAANTAAQMQQYQAQLQQGSATTGGLFGLGGTVLGAGLKYGLPLLAGSDIRIKENIKHVGKTTDGQNLWFFTYKNDPTTPHVGLMAQEVELIHPEAVFEIDGVKHVDYGLALRGSHA